MPPDQPQRLAAWLAGALGGPPAREGGEFRPSVIGPSAGQFTEEQRARWAALAGTAADQAGLPADAAFRSVFSACVDWASRTALEQRGRRAGAGAGAALGMGPGRAARRRRRRIRQRTRRTSPRTCRDRTSR